MLVHKSIRLCRQSFQTSLSSSALRSWRHVYLCNFLGKCSIFEYFRVLHHHIFFGRDMLKQLLLFGLAKFYFFLDAVMAFLDGLLNVHIFFGIVLDFFGASSSLQSIWMTEVRVDIKTRACNDLSV